MCSAFLCHACLSTWLFLWFLICGLVQVLYLSLVVKFYFFNSLVPVTTLGLDLFSVTYLT